MAKLVHSMIRVLDEARSVEFYDRAFGLKLLERLAFDSFTLIYLANAESGFELELTVNHDRTEPYDLGTGYGHLAVTVADIDAEHARFEREGLAPRKLVDFRHGDRVLTRFFFVQDPDGYQIEVIRRGGRFN